MNDSPGLAAKVVAVTGAGRGIGRAIALYTASLGASVVVNDLGGSADGFGSDGGPASEVAAEITGAGGRAYASKADVTDPEGAKSIIDDAIKQFGRVDGVVNNAGFLRDVIFHKMTQKDFEDVVRVHLFGSFNVAQAAATHFRAQESGAYVHLVSASGLIGNYAQANYSAAKMGIVGLSNSIALDMNRFHVRSNCIAPFAWSRLTGTLPESTPEEKARVAKFQAMSPETIAPMAGFLLSDAAAGITGQVFSVRNKEISVFTPMRPVRTIHRGDGWTQATLSEHMLPALRSHFHRLERSSDVFSWDPV
jgi:NAD(P)-dependent dehydrogenase (short-subunit alcohol dehydrogenase family)